MRFIGILTRFFIRSRTVRPHPDGVNAVGGPRAKNVSTIAHRWLQCDIRDRDSGLCAVLG